MGTRERDAHTGVRVEPGPETQVGVSVFEHLCVDVCCPTVLSGVLLGESSFRVTLCSFWVPTPFWGGARAGIQAPYSWVPPGELCVSLT